MTYSPILNNVHFRMLQMTHTRSALHVLTLDVKYILIDSILSLNDSLLKFTLICGLIRPMSVYMGQINPGVFNRVKI